MAKHNRFPRFPSGRSRIDPQATSADVAQHRDGHGSSGRVGAGRGFGPPWARFARDDGGEGAEAGEAFRGRRRGQGPGPGGWGGPWGPGFGGGPGAFGGPGGPAGRGRQRRNRGDVRTAILWLLADRPMHGYELITEVEAASGGSWRPSPGAIYPTLSMLADEGLVTTDGSIGPSAAGGRKVFELTEAGRAEAATLRAGEPPWGQTVAAADNIGESAKALGAAVWQIARTGTTDERAAAKAVIDRAKRDLYRILAGDTPVPGQQATADGETEPGRPD